jgi:hypothetical protein
MRIAVQNVFDFLDRFCSDKVSIIHK